MPEEKQLLSVQSVTAETHEELFNEALNYIQTREPYDAKDRQHAIAYYNDAHPAFGGGSRCILWFDSQKELLEAIPGLILVMNSQPRGLESRPDIQENLATFAAAFWQEEITQSEALKLVNQGAKGFFQIEWWGTREKLLRSEEEFPKWLRSGWRGSEDGSPLRDDESEDFFEYLSCDYMC